MVLTLDLNKDRKGEGAFGLRRRIPLRKLDQQCKAHTVVLCAQAIMPQCDGQARYCNTAPQRIKFLSLKPALAMVPRLA